MKRSSLRSYPAGTRSRTLERFRAGVPLLLVAFLFGCGENYCQSGPKYGMQCYTINEVEWQETQVRGETVAERYRGNAMTPSPGCVLATPSGLVQEPMTATAVGASSTSYVMSGACTTRREPAYGAVR